MMQIPARFSLIPGYVDLVKHENDVRNGAMLNLNIRICGIEIQQMTLRHWLILDGIDSPLLGSGDPNPVDVAKFLWVLSPRFHPHAPFRRHRFLRGCRNVPYGEAVMAIRQFVDDTFQDSPPSSGDDKWTAPQVSFGASVIFSVAIKLHWSREAILDLPLKESFQHMKLLRMRNEAECGEKPIGWNPSDSLAVQHRRKVRAERDAEKAAQNAAIDPLQGTSADQ
jgi:hypothetical protein